MKRNRSHLWLFIFILNKLQWTNASVAGVTYMDNFDFQERYRDVNECNPFYWHPLHLPEECMDIFNTLIRSRVQTFSPYRIFKEQEKPVEQAYPYSVINTPIYVTEVRLPPPLSPPPPPPPPTPFQVLFELLKRDIRENPSAAIVQTSPYFGSVLMYKQPVSFKSVSMIKKLARTYDNAYPLLNTNTEADKEEEEEFEKAKKKYDINEKHSN